MGEIVGELRALRLFARHHLGLQAADLLHMAAQAPQKLSTFRQPLGQNVPCAFKRCLGVRHSLGDIGRRQSRRIGVTIGQDRVMQRLQPVLARDHRLCAALGLEGQVDILQLGLGGRLCQHHCQSLGHLALFGDRPHDGCPPCFHLAQVDQPLGQGPQLGVVQPARRLFAIARDKGHSGPFIQKRNGRLHLRGPSPDFGGDYMGKTGQSGGGGGGHAIPQLLATQSMGRQTLPPPRGRAKGL